MRKWLENLIVIIFSGRSPLTCCGGACAIRIGKVLTFDKPLVQPMTFSLSLSLISYEINSSLDGTIIMCIHNKVTNNLQYTLPDLLLYAFLLTYLKVCLREK